MRSNGCPCSRCPDSHKVLNEFGRLAISPRTCHIPLAVENLILGGIPNRNQRAFVLTELRDSLNPAISQSSVNLIPKCVRRCFPSRICWVAYSRLRLVVVIF